MSITITETVDAGDLSGTSVDVVFGATPSDGEMIVFAVGTRGSTRGACTGFTDQYTGVGAGAENTGLSDWVHFLTKEASSESSATYTITGLTSDVHAIIGYRLTPTNGWHTTAIEDGSGSFDDTGSQTSCVIPSSTATPQSSSEAIMIAMVALRQDLLSETWSWSNSFTQDDECVYGSDPYMTNKTASRIVSSTTTIGTTCSWTTSDDYQLGAMLTIIEGEGSVTTSGTLNGGGGISATAAKFEDQIARPSSTGSAGTWDTGPTTGQSLHGYTSDESDSTYIEDTAS